MKANQFREYDYGTPEANQQHYGRRHGTPPSIDISTIPELGIPIAMFAGAKDRLNPIDDVRWTKDQISKSSQSEHWLTGKKLKNVLVHYEEDNASHLSWFIGNDMSYLNRVIDLVKKWNPRPLTPDEKKYMYIAG